MTRGTFSRVILSAAIFTFLGCGQGELSVDRPTIGPDNIETIASQLSAAQRRARAQLIRDSAARRGLTNGVLLAGIADSETNMAHCWSEATWACQGPASSSCGGGPVIAGSGDGPCANRQGGLGMFQFDGGTHDQTLAREGRRILTIEGNTMAAVDFVVHKVKISDFIPNVSTDDQALTWMNEVRPNTREWDQWIRTVTGYYNGCFEGRCSVFHERYNRYDTRTRNVLAEFGDDFWYRLSGNGGVTDPSGGSASDPSGPSASDPSGNSSQPSAAPSIPRDLNPVDAEVPLGGSVALNWTSVNATSYNVRMEYLEGSTWQHYYEWERTRSVFEVWPQVRDTTYRWTVRACNANGCSSWSIYSHFNYGTTDSTGAASSGNTGSSGGDTSSNTDSSTNTGTSSNSGSSSNSPPPSSGVPGMPASMSPAGVRIDSPDVPLSWSEPSGATSYDIIMYYHHNGDWAEYYLWEGKSGGAFTVWPVVDENYYAWAIRACNGMGCSEWSDFQQFYFAGL